MPADDGKLLSIARPLSYSHIEGQSVLTDDRLEEYGYGSGHLQSQWFEYFHSLFLQFWVEAHGRGWRVRHARLIPV